MKTEITVGIVEDHSMFREVLAELLEEYQNIKVLFKARNGIVMQDDIAQHGLPDVIIMDINMKEMDGFEATKWVKEHYPAIHILALSMYEDTINIIKMIRLGAGGYVLKNANSSEVVRGIESLVKTNYFLNEQITGRLIQAIRNDETGSIYGTSLTKRETEFIKLCCSEFTYKEIADLMKISVKTVNNYREALFEKLNCRSRVGLVLFAIKNKIVIINN